MGTTLYLRLLRLTHYPHLAWGLTMAAYRMHLPLDRYADKLLDCLIGAFLLRGSACTVNDIFDRHVDAGVGELVLSCLTALAILGCGGADDV